MFHNSITSRDFLPYCIDRVSGDTFVLLNRRYRPIAMPESTLSLHVNRSIHFKSDDLTPEVATKLSIHDDPNTNRIYFFDDGSAPWLGKRQGNAYEKRMEILRRLLENLCEPSTAQIRSSSQYSP
jgi:hypothetical protein